ncbi:hypothetical protein MNEG_3247 [Monoraphidium neglectum]|uniref:Uncharacterized protein n=1 Tax=Monoraphidium neglectum TaxID=145388 RepID=A0A0D2MPY4_9CHLO|nr:hypothetical protein MNEG_3247 [Monoraphidium neglectum]KIZ04715.1 hypothetical protein MNEG_3247 [Monoraphidium neglectum]|eukprot:XP_013903734.1 hypothetical protein MNEG_3247 [Monoraphidium neglectum]
MRAQLASALVALLAAPHLQPEALVLDGAASGTDTEVASAATAAVAAAARSVGQSLVSRLQHVLGALLSGSWAGWLRGSNKRLREVPAYGGTAHLWAALDGLPQHRLPDALRARIRAALPLPPEPAPLLLPEPLAGAPALAAADDMDDSGGPGSGGERLLSLARRWDPWTPLQPLAAGPPAIGAVSSAGVGSASLHGPVAPAVLLLAGCVKRRGGALAYAGGHDDDDCVL